jgi:2-oxoisovalerate dehydrogenase E1 component beta subunit
MAEINLVEAINQALAFEMAQDARVVVLGEDVGINGGVFRATAGLRDKFGEARVVDTPLAEVMIGSMAFGLAVSGWRPVAEIQFSGFMYSNLDGIVNHVSRIRHRTRGRLTCPMVMRSPCGGGIRAPEHHSESPEAMFAHVPGIRVIYPSSPSRAYGLLLASIRDPDPVIFLEPTRLYRLFKEEVPDSGEALPLDVCFIDREGSDLTLVSWGASMHECRAAADSLAGEGISVEVIDVATIKPLDMETITKSVSKTGRCVIVHEAPRCAGFGAEIAANLAESGLMSLLAPVRRVTGFDVVTPLAKLEKLNLPSVERIAGTARETVKYS